MRIVRLKTSQISYFGPRRAQCVLKHRPFEAQAKDVEAEECKPLSLVIYFIPIMS